MDTVAVGGYRHRRAGRCRRPRPRPPPPPRRTLRRSLRTRILRQRRVSRIFLAGNLKWRVFLSCFEREFVKAGFIACFGGKFSMAGIAIQIWRNV